MENQSYSITSKILLNLKQIQLLLNSAKYQDINESNNIKRYNLPGRFAEVERRLEHYDKDQVVVFKDELNFERLIDHWNKFEQLFDGTASLENKKNFGDLIKLTTQLLEYLRTVPIDKPKGNIGNEDIISLNGNTQRKLDEINNRRAKLKEAIEKAKSEKPIDHDKVSKLQAQFDQLGKDLVSTRVKMEEVKADTDERVIQDQKLKDAFAELKTDTIDEERKRLKIEYWISLYSLFFFMLVLIIFYGAFVYNVINYNIIITSFIQYLPYSVGLLMFIGLIAVCIYLKGRANKISIELSTRLFNIHYLEGLMKMNIRLSSDANVSAERLNEIVGTLEHSYIEQIGKNIVPERQISKWEKNEAKDSPYLKLLMEIKDTVVKLLNK